jgi:hypothetical protein
MPLQTSHTQTSAEHSTSRVCHTLARHAVCIVMCLYSTNFETASAVVLNTVQWIS